MSRRAAGIALAAVFAAQLLVVITTAARDPHVDEIEYLHAGWLMKNGARLYTDFFEHHSPLLFAPLEWLAPRGEGADVKPFAMQARYLFGACGLAALGAFAAILWRIDPWAAVIGVSALFSTGMLWLRAIADVRAEPLALALFWIGVLCAMRSRGAAGGIGIGLLVVAGLITPKWPLTSAFVATLWLVRAERKVRGLVAAILVALAGFIAIRALVPFDQWWHFNFDVNRAIAAGLASSAGTLLRPDEPFLFVPALFRPLLMLAVAAVVLVRRDRMAVAAVAFFVVTAVEIRFVLPYPYLWAHYFAMWSFAAAALFALVPRALERIRFVRPAAIALLLLVLWTNAFVLWAIGRGGDGIYWRSRKTLVAALKPGERVWLPTTRHPISARDAHYYWFAPYEISAALGPKGPWPVCAGTARLIGGPKMLRGLESELRCFERLRAEGRLRRTPVPEIYEVLR
jgi:hypothetical protein